MQSQTTGITLPRPRYASLSRIDALLRDALRRARIPEADNLPPHIRRDIGLPPEVHRPTHAPPRVF